MSAEKFQTLKEMGFENPHDIERFTTRTENDVDVLKVYLHRHQGDWMAKSKKFKFKRKHTNVSVEGGLVPYRASTEPSPYYLRALSELEKLVAQDKSVKDKKELLLDEIEHLEKVVARKVEDIRRQIEEL
ncbi:DUF3461 family protein [Amphritea balenae]|uniref:DUF3461 family protein n=1 Tax=Amphritea balenae TaxID=452629 RepID=A0A3P1SQS8_9GAMM|nr:DUF3461 family protein [Amphritea balenae]RRC98512.1 DUF3461 family protein [Amphritea balenae]GGK65185.1 UPF0325 protein [Amphritea balenae]